MKRAGCFWSVLTVMVLMASNLFAEETSRPPMMGGRMEKPSDHPKMSGRPFFSLEGLKESLSLTDDQAKKLHDLFIEYRKGMIQKKASLQVAEIELEETLGEPKLDLAKVEKKVKEKEAAASDMMMFRVRSLAKAKEFLSDAQFSQFRTMIERRMSFGGKRPWMSGGRDGKMEREGGTGFGMEKGRGPHPFSGMMEDSNGYDDEEGR